MYGDGLWGASASKISRCTHLCRTASPRWKAGRRWGARSLPRGRRSPSWADSGRWSWRWCRRCRWQCSAAARSQCRAAASRARTGTPTRTSCPKTKDGGSCHWTGLCNNYPHKLRKFRSRPKDFWPKAEREFFERLFRLKAKIDRMPKKFISVERWAFRPHKATLLTPNFGRNYPLSAEIDHFSRNFSFGWNDTESPKVSAASSSVSFGRGRKIPKICGRHIWKPPYDTRLKQWLDWRTFEESKFFFADSSGHVCGPDGNTAAEDTSDGSMSPNTATIAANPCSSQVSMIGNSMETKAAAQLWNSWHD